jgi:hypothetical protein
MSSLGHFTAALSAPSAGSCALRNVFYTNPPLYINQQQLREGFAIIDRMDTALES